MAIPTSQLAPFLYSGNVTAITTNQLIAAITGAMLQMGWTTTGAGVLRCVPDSQGRFFEMEVNQNTGVTLSNQIQFAVYQQTKAVNNNVLINKGYQLTTGSSYKIYATPYSIYSEENSGGGMANGKFAYAAQVYCDPLTSGQLAGAIIAGGFKNYAGTNQSTTSMSNAGSVYNGTSGSNASSSDWLQMLSASTAQMFNQWKGGRLMMFENWVAFTNSEGLMGRMYNTLVAGGNGLNGFEIPSGTGTISYIRLDGFTNSTNFAYYIRIT